MITEVLVEKQWFKACKTEDVPSDGGACVKYKDEQIAIFFLERKNEWYATQNMCPHKKQMILSRGMIGDQAGEPKVACPFHKQTFNLKTGENMCGDHYTIKTYGIKIENGYVFIDVSTLMHR